MHLPGSSVEMDVGHLDNLRRLVEPYNAEGLYFLRQYDTTCLWEKATKGGIDPRPECIIDENILDEALARQSWRKKNKDRC